MRCIPKPWIVDAILRREEKINPRPQYQRAPVWSLPKKQKLIDSILRSYDIPKIYLRESLDDAYEHEVVDGQQRLRAIWEFANNEYPLGDDSRDLPKWGDLSEKKYNELSSDVQDCFGLFELSIVVIEDADDSEIRDLFLRLQEGVSLNPAEKRNAMTGKMRDFVADLAKHPVFQLVGMKPDIRNRYGRDDWIAHITCLEAAGNAVDIKAYNLEQMYKTQQNFKPSGPIATKINRILNYMERVLDSETPEMDIKWGFVDLYWLISTLDAEYVLKDREQNFQSFYRTFEKQRRDVDDIEELVQSKEYLDNHLFDYIQAYQRAGATKRNIQIRHTVYRYWFHNLYPNLVPKDPRRRFTDDQRMVIWRRAQEKCENCGKQLDFAKMQADHVVPYAKGGATTIKNAQSLCGNCNLQKGSTS